MSVLSTASAVCGRRLCAVAAAASGLLHATMIGHAATPMMAVLIIAMAAACVSCAYHLWRAGSQQVWCLVAVMNLAMIGIHMSAPAHQHGTTGPVAAAPPPTPMMSVATGVALGEAAVAALVLCVLAWRHRARTASLVGIR